MTLAATLPHSAALDMTANLTAVTGQIPVVDTSANTVRIPAIQPDPQHALYYIYQGIRAGRFCAYAMTGLTAFFAFMFGQIMGLGGLAIAGESVLMLAIAIVISHLSPEATVARARTHRRYVTFFVSSGLVFVALAIGPALAEVVRTGLGAF